MLGAADQEHLGPDDPSAEDGGDGRTLLCLLEELCIPRLDGTANDGKIDDVHTPMLCGHEPPSATVFRGMARQGVFC